MFPNRRIKNKRSELILFYLENLKDFGFTRVELEPDAKRKPKAKKAFQEFAARALNSFKITDCSQ
jgi:hypothetical protein